MLAAQSKSSGSSSSSTSSDSSSSSSSSDRKKNKKKKKGKKSKKDKKSKKKKKSKGNTKRKCDETPAERKAREKMEKVEEQQRLKIMKETKKSAEGILNKVVGVKASLEALISKSAWVHVSSIVKDPCEQHLQKLRELEGAANAIIANDGEGSAPIDAKELNQLVNDVKRAVQLGSQMTATIGKV